ncbi:MAG: thioredoxin domain-containing protein [Acidobacteria bacterium]|nr:thioredoxin domain-containing protein [Acidobacteriota bacterium]
MAHPYTNQLIHETSPYLLQHAHNPVNWYPWSGEALRLAREQNKPIFLSIGYAACHWCHVMEHESFEDEEVAEILNEHFIPVKVDREERPDLDEIYMNATILYTRGHGGWPMSVWLTPSGEPIYAGTYFPREDYYGRPGFKTVLERLAQVWQEKGNEIAADANQVTQILQQMQSPARGEILPRPALLEAARQMTEAFDPRFGGVAGGSNKFPPSMCMEFLLREYHSEGEESLRAIVELTLEKMAQGGIYDHLGGGFHRYSTDPGWLVPHFEKMLYDQALVSSIYLDAWQLSRRGEFAETARGIFDYVLANLQSPEGGFYSTEDADSEGQEGKFYIWTLQEVQEALGEEAALFLSYYDVTEEGNWHHPGDAHVPSGPKNILRVKRAPEEVAREHSLPVTELKRRLGGARQKLLQVRQQRVRPALDDKILAAWNGLMIASLAKGAAALEEPRYGEAAARAADFVLTQMRREGRLLRSWRGGEARLVAYLDDYAFLIEGLLGLYELSGKVRWLAEAERLLDTAIAHYWDTQDGGFFFTASDHEKLIVRSKLANDNAIPSGNSVMVRNLLRLHVLRGRRELHNKAEEILSLFSGAAARALFGHERLLCGMHDWQEGLQEIAIIGNLQDSQTRQLLRVVQDSYLPNKVVALLDPSWPDVSTFTQCVPLLADKEALNGKPTAYVCRNFACQQPTQTPEQLQKQLQKVSPSRNH